MDVRPYSTSTLTSQSQYDHSVSAKNTKNIHLFISIFAKKHCAQNNQSYNAKKA